MATIASPPAAAEQRVFLYDVSWRTYKSLLDDRGERTAPRYAFDRGVLEIVSPLSTEHEVTNRLLAGRAELVAEEWSVEFLNAGGMTYQREDLQQGFEPESSFYFGSVQQVRGKARIDLQLDPPPDLVIEIDVTNLSLRKFAISAGVGVPEVWRYALGRVTIHVRDGEGYRADATSAALPPLTSEVLTRFVAGSQAMGQLAWRRAVRDWARGQRDEARQTMDLRRTFTI